MGAIKSFISSWLNGGGRKEIYEITERMLQFTHFQSITFYHVMIKCKALKFFCKLQHSFCYLVYFLWFSLEAACFFDQFVLLHLIQEKFKTLLQILKLILNILTTALQKIIADKIKGTNVPFCKTSHVSPLKNTSNRVLFTVTYWNLKSKDSTTYAFLKTLRIFSEK